MMAGYIEYTDTSIYSPVYDHEILIGDTYYPSPHSAIEDGHDVDDVIVEYVYNYRDLYYPYRHYTFKGTYSDSLNRAIEMLLVSRVEPTTIGKYVYMLPRDASLPRGMPILRNNYLLSHIRDNIYRQTSVLDALEEYDVHIIDDTLLYVGEGGMFLLLDDIQKDISPILDRIQRSR